MATIWENLNKTRAGTRGVETSIPLATTVAPTTHLKTILTFFMLFMVFVGMLGLSACTNPNDLPSESTPSATETLEETESWPLTGVKRLDSEPHPAVAVKVENTKAARPQSGLESADIVFEEMVEGGLTRFNAIFHSQIPDEIGPVRSVRPMDTAIAAPMQALLVYSGGVAVFERKVVEAGLRGFNEDQALGALYRVKSRKIPHNLYLSIPQLFQKIEVSADAEPQPYFEYANTSDGEVATAVSTGDAVTQLNVVFPAAKVGYSWNGTRWQRSDGEVPSTANSGAYLAADNVVVIRTTTMPTEVMDSAGFPVPETVLSGGGQAWVATGGKILPVRWSKDSEASPLLLSTEAGAPVTLQPGQTWVELTTTDGFSFQ